MDKYFNWIVRAVFAACLLFVYFFACETHACRFRAYGFLFINMSLAYIPVEISFHLNPKTPRALFWALFPLWLLFYPNAPYMLTDFFHLAKFEPYIITATGAKTHLLLPDIGMWTAYTILSTGILVAMFFGTWSLDHVTDSLIARFSVRRRALAKFALIVAISACAAAGIYLGRFPRLHTVDLFMRPSFALEQISSACGAHLLQFTALLTFLQTVLWALYKITNKHRAAAPADATAT